MASVLFSNMLSTVLNSLFSRLCRSLLCGVIFKRKVIYQNTSHGKSFPKHTVGIKGYYRCPEGGRAIDAVKVQPGFS